MAREYARVKVAIWADDEFRLLSDSAQALYFRLISSPTMSLCGVADWRPKRIAALTAGMNVDRVAEVGCELAEAGYIVIDDDTEEVLVRSFVRHDGLIKTPNIAASMVKDYAGVASRTLQGVIVHELHRLHDEDPGMTGWSKASVLLSRPSIDPSGIPSPRMASVNPSGMPSPIPSGNGSDIPQPSSHNQQPAAHSPKTAEPPGFEAFWAVYPKRQDKGHARTAWVKAVRKADPSTITAGAERFRDDPNREPQYTALAATWLNGERWGDDPLPAKTTANPQPTGDRVRGALDRARELAEQESQGLLQIGGTA